MELTKEFVTSCRNVGALRDFLCQAMDQVDALTAENKRLDADNKKLTNHVIREINVHTDMERAIRRALWLARAKRARAEKWTSCGTFEKWLKTQHLCEAKAEEYK